VHYFKFNIGDYASHTQHLSLIEDLAYRRMLESYYLAERPLNAGITSVARQIRMREYETEVKTVLEEFFTLTADGWVHSGADRDIADYHGKIEQASKAGKASAERRSNGRLTDVQPTTNQEPLTKNHKPVVTAAKRRIQLPGDFYPNESGVSKSEEKGLSLAIELTKFSDYHRGKGSLMADWQAAWRTWIGNARPPTSTQTETAYQRSMRERVDQAIGRNRVYEPAPQFLEIEQ
jgi:uncharacterized protein YdaU (DUF1376 family)